MKQGILFHRWKLDVLRNVSFRIVSCLISTYIIKNMPYRTPTQKPVCVADVNTVRNLLRHLQFISRD